MIYKSIFAAIALVALTLPTVLADAPPVPGERSDLAQWVGSWEVSNELNQTLGFVNEDSRQEASMEHPVAFQIMSFDRSIGEPMEPSKVAAYRETYFDRWGHQLVATGSWKLTFDVDSKDEGRVNSGDEQDCFVTQHAGATYLWSDAAFVLFGGNISFIKGVDSQHDILIIDFNAVSETRGAYRTPDTVAYRRAREDVRHRATINQDGKSPHLSATPRSQPVEPEAESLLWGGEPVGTSPPQPGVVGRYQVSAYSMAGGAHNAAERGAYIIDTATGELFFAKDQRKPAPIGSVRDDNEAEESSRISVTARTKDGKVYKLYGYDALSYSVMNNDADALRRLLMAGTHDLDAGARRGEWTLLQTAVHRGCIETTSLLLEHGADPNLAREGTPVPGTCGTG